MGPFDAVPVEGLLIQHLRILQMQTPRYSVKWTVFGSSSTWTVQNSLDNADACKPLTQDCPPSLVKSITGHYNSTGTHNTSLSCQHTARESSRTHLQSAQGHKCALPRLLEICQKPPKEGHLFTQDSLGGTNGV